MDTFRRVMVVGLVIALLPGACGTPAPGGVPFRSDPFHLALTLPPGWAAAEGPEWLARPFTGLVAFNSWGATDFWAPQVQTESGASYSRQSTLSQVPGGQAYVVLIHVSGGPVMDPETYGPEYEREDLGGIWNAGDCREAGGATAAEFFKWGRFLRLEVYCQPDASEGTAAEVGDVLASWRFDRVPVGDPGWASVRARALLPSDVQPERFPVLSAWSVEGQPAVSSVASGEVTRVTRAEARGDTLTITSAYRWDDPDPGLRDEECPPDRCHWWRFGARPSGEVVLMEEGGASLPGGPEDLASPLPSTPAAAPSLSPSPAPSTATLTAVPVSPTAAPRTPAPSATAPPPVTDLVPPLVVDRESGRLYVTGRVDGVQQIVALAAEDGRLLATYGLTGPFDVDPIHGRLYVDQGDSGLAVLDIQSGARQTTVPLPSSTGWRRTHPAPQADPTTGQVLAFRGNGVYVVDPDLGAVVDTISFDIPKAGDCRTLTDPLPIEWAVYDGARRLLYLNFLTYVCTPWLGETLVSYDLNANAEIARQGVTWSTATASAGELYGSSWYRMGVGYRWAWRDGQPWFESEGWTNSPKLFVDAARGRLYESSSSHGFRTFDLETMSLLFILPSPVDGDLVGYDPGTDQLYYLVEGQLATWPASAILPPSPQALPIADPPTKPVRYLSLSSVGPQAQVLFGLWDYGSTSGNCYVFGAQGGLLYLSADGGTTWVQPRGGLGGGCERISALAVSPDYATHRTMLASLVGNGIFQSTDGGHLWRPSSTGLRSMSVDDILLSPGFGSDQIAFARSRVLGQGNLYRSADGGATWKALGVDLNAVAMSPEFDQDGVLMGVSAGQVVVSRDSGQAWEPVGSVPDGESFTRLSLAPLFDRWRVAFAFGGSSQSLYRSVDGGRSWQEVLAVGGSAGVPFSPQLAYGPETDTGRLLFLLAIDTDRNVDPPAYRGTLYRSDDGGVSWEALALPADMVPTALAISPTFAQDGLLWLGTADGRVLALKAALLHGGP